MSRSLSTSARPPLRAGARYRVDLRALMEQCERNYVYLLRWLQVMGEADELELALPDAPGTRLTLRVQERARYTTFLELRQQGGHPLLPGPCLKVCLYHDARSAEVTAAPPWRRVTARHDYPNPDMHQPDEKQQWNQFLHEWLRHLNRAGL